MTRMIRQGGESLISDSNYLYEGRACGDGTRPGRHSSYCSGCIQMTRMIRQGGNTNSQQITNNDNNSTFNSAQLTSFLSLTADETIKSVPMDQHYYRLASSSLLARTADRTRKTFALQGYPSRLTLPLSSKRSPYIVSRGRT
ncbi:hypothetical protein AVEN_101534-1 [Araneus ventricosus]|uniref:Uncharacterized protein n=1 Tax=Araneus ventricosus TaxID=182803 RepID=A0A4Y2GQM9_ARAVE|nr:hypothetical protein AVEN_101534-1 [Araneus ventricosus]